MPSQKEVRWSQLKVGILVVLALSALTALVFLMSDSYGGFTGKITVRSYFENAAGLKIGAPVNLEGVTIGNVTSIRIVKERNPAPVEIRMRVSKQYISSLHSDSKASIQTAGVLGDSIVDIDSKFAVGPTLQNGEEMGTSETPNIQDVVKASQTTVEQISTILVKLDKIVDQVNSDRGAIGLLIRHPEVYYKVNDVMSQVQILVNQIVAGKGSVGKLMQDDGVYDHLNHSLEHLDRITKELDEGKGSAGKLIHDETLYKNLSSSVATLNQLLTEINSGKGTLGVLAKDPETSKRVVESIGHLNNILSDVDAGKGTLGALAKNPKLYQDTDATLVESRNLLEAIRKDPKRYLTIRLKMF